MTHTPTPWRLQIATMFESDETYVRGVVDSTGRNIRLHAFSLSSGDVAEANTALVVKAVNIFDELVSTLEQVQAYWEESEEFPSRLSARIEAVIALARQP